LFLTRVLFSILFTHLYQSLSEPAFSRHEGLIEQISAFDRGGDGGAWDADSPAALLGDDSDLVSSASSGSASGNGSSGSSGSSGGGDPEEEAFNATWQREVQRQRREQQQRVDRAERERRAAEHAQAQQRRAAAALQMQQQQPHLKEAAVVAATETAAAAEVADRVPTIETVCSEMQYYRDFFHYSCHIATLPSVTFLIRLCFLCLLPIHRCLTVERAYHPSIHCTMF
jgi:hypothetical protein